MAEAADQIQTVGALIDDLRDLGLTPVLVGGMALVIHGSRRVTHDYDFVITHPGNRLDRTLDCLYARGLELVSRVDDAGQVLATIDNRTVASTRLRLDRPAGAYFHNRKTGLRVDLLFDFPTKAATLASRAVNIRIRSYLFAVASNADLLELKKIASAARAVPGDADDIAFLEARLNGR